MYQVHVTTTGRTQVTYWSANCKLLHWMMLYMHLTIPSQVGKAFGMPQLLIGAWKLTDCNLPCITLWARASIWELHWSPQIVQSNRLLYDCQPQTCFTMWLRERKKHLAAANCSSDGSSGATLGSLLPFPLQAELLLYLASKEAINPFIWVGALPLKHSQLVKMHSHTEALPAIVCCVHLLCLWIRIAEDGWYHFWQHNRLFLMCRALHEKDRGSQAKATCSRSSATSSEAHVLRLDKTLLMQLILAVACDTHMWQLHAHRLKGLWSEIFAAWR